MNVGVVILRSIIICYSEHDVNDDHSAILQCKYNKDHRASGATRKLSLNGLVSALVLYRELKLAILPAPTTVAKPSTALTLEQY